MLHDLGKFPSAVADRGCYHGAMRRCAWSSWLLVLACAARPAEPEAGGVTTNPSGTELGSEASSEANSEDSSTVGATTSTTGGGDGDGDGSGDGDGDECVPAPKLDIPPDPDPPLPDSCTVEPLDWAEVANYSGCTLCNDWETGCYYAPHLACATPGPGQTCADLCPSGNCAGFDWSLCMGELEASASEPSDWCGHYEIDGKCCTVGTIFYVCGE
jgi:hypothetical protein